MVRHDQTSRLDDSELFPEAHDGPPMSLLHLYFDDCSGAKRSSLQSGSCCDRLTHMS